MMSSRPAAVLFCGWRKAATGLAVIDLTAGEMGCRGISQTRIEEAKFAAGVLKLSLRGNMGFPDTKLVNWVEYREKLALEIRALIRGLSFFPTGQARHPDHSHASEIAFDACFLAGLRKLDPETARAAFHRNLFVAVCQRDADIRSRYHPRI